VADWHWVLVTDDLLDGLPPAALAVSGERVVIVQVNWIS
jgi:hypothetical protein